MPRFANYSMRTPENVRLSISARALVIGASYALHLTFSKDPLRRRVPQFIHQTPASPRAPRANQHGIILTILFQGPRNGHGISPRQVSWT